MHESPRDTRAAQSTEAGLSQTGIAMAANLFGTILAQTRRGSVDILAERLEVAEHQGGRLFESRPAGRKIIAQRCAGAPIRAAFARIGVVERWVGCNSY